MNRHQHHRDAQPGFINRVSKDGPASKAGRGPGDLIVGVNGKTVRSQEDFLLLSLSGP
ncbi:MAG: PDZ domain-containing protein [Rhodospirillales bacterium]|nr:PDZ domain-containing protein [Rhodospirillales bacterium]MDP7424425.1 PDZ domain-containing protein [Rhodospirillales bacterium]